MEMIGADELTARERTLDKAERLRERDRDTVYRAYMTRARQLERYAVQSPTPNEQTARYADQRGKHDLAARLRER